MNVLGLQSPVLQPIVQQRTLCYSRELQRSPILPYLLETKHSIRGQFQNPPPLKNYKIIETALDCILRNLVSYIYISA